MKIGSIPLAALATALALTLGACGGNEDTTAAVDQSVSASGDADTTSAEEPAEGACALLDEAELAELLGGPVTHSGKRASSMEGEGCTWNREDLKSGAGVVSLTFLNDDDESYFRQSGLGPGDESYRPIGDGASMETGSIIVLVGDRAFVITGTGPVESPTTLEALAKTAASRQ